MKRIIKSGETLRFVNFDTSMERLPNGVYTLCVDENEDFYLEEVDGFKFPERLYGDFSFIKKWINTYRCRSGNTGIFLSGLKGDGKTVTAKMIASESGLPTVIIPAAYGGHNFERMLCDPRLGDCAFIFDEFEKTYEQKDNGRMKTLLNILDGVYHTHHLFIMVSNSESINENLKGRPSRIFYHKRFSGISMDILKGLAEDIITDKSMIPEYLDTVQLIPKLSYDVARSVAEEVERYHMSARESIRDMSVSTSSVQCKIFRKMFSMDGEDYYICLTRYSETFNPEDRFISIQSCRTLSENEFVEINGGYDVCDEMAKHVYYENRKKDSKAPFDIPMTVENAIKDPDMFRKKSFRYVPLYVYSDVIERSSIEMVNPGFFKGKSIDGSEYIIVMAHCIGEDHFDSLDFRSLHTEKGIINMAGGKTAGEISVTLNKLKVSSLDGYSNSMDTDVVSFNIDSDSPSCGEVSEEDDAIFTPGN